IVRANAAAAAATPTSARFDEIMSMSSPAGTCVVRPASPLIVRTAPIFAGVHPFSARWTAIKGPKPMSRAARKKFNQSSAFRLSTGSAASRLLREVASIVPACHLRDLRELRSEAAPHDRFRVALLQFKLCLVAVAPEVDIKSLAAEMKIEQR